MRRRESSIYLGVAWPCMFNIVWRAEGERSIADASLDQPSTYRKMAVNVSPVRRAGQ